MKRLVILHHDFARDEMLGGANETLKAILDQATSEGHETAWYAWSADDAAAYWEGPLHLVGNMARAPSHVLAAIPRPRVVFCNNSLVHTNEVYETADLLIFLAPDHQRRGTDIKNPRAMVYAPFVDPEQFRDVSRPRDSKRVLFVGDIQPHKISEAMVTNSRLPIVAIGNGSNREYVGRLRGMGTTILDSVPPHEVPLHMNAYETFYWQLERYGCFGRVLVEAAFCGMRLDVNRENFGLFAFSWGNDLANGRNLDQVGQALRHELDTFWSRVDAAL